MDERELILKTRAGNREAFGELVKTYQQKIFFTTYRLLRNEEDAQDLTQEAFISAYQAIKGFRLRSGFYTWLYRIAINLCYHRLRSGQYKIKLKTKSLDELVDLVSSEPAPDAVAVSEERKEIVRRALVSLKRKFYQAVVLYDLEGLSYKEIARIQHCSLGTVMSRLHRGRLQLAKQLRNLGINLT